MNWLEYMTQKSLSTTELAKKIGYTRQHLDGVLNGKFKMGKKLAVALVKALKDVSATPLTPEDLMKKNLEIYNERNKKKTKDFIKFKKNTF